jgi:hypothetical protein
MVFLTRRGIFSLLMLQEVLADNDFPRVSSARRLVNISGTVRAIDLKFSQVKYMGLHVKWKGLLQPHHFHSGINWN